MPPRNLAAAMSDVVWADEGVTLRRSIVIGALWFLGEQKDDDVHRYGEKFSQHLGASSEEDSLQDVVKLRLMLQGCQ